MRNECAHLYSVVRKSEAGAHFCFYLWNALTKSDNFWCRSTWAAVYSKYSVTIRSEYITSSCWLQIKSCTIDDVVSGFGGFKMTATRITVSRTISIIFGRVGQDWFWTSPSVGIPSSDAVSSTTFQVAVFYDDIVFFSEFSFPTGISTTLKCNFVRR